MKSPFHRVFTDIVSRDCAPEGISSRCRPVHPEAGSVAAESRMTLFAAAS